MANEEQIRVWNEINAQRWLKLRGPLVKALVHFGDRALDALQPTKGEVALDVGCGFGDTTVELARRTGNALGVDITEPFLRIAKDEAAHGARYLLADAQTHRFEEKFDLCFSRFGVMFFEDPAAAFANLHAALREGGRFAAVAWETWQENEWVTLPLRIARRRVTVPDPAQGPGPFALGKPGLFEELLRGAGFRGCAVKRLPGVFDADAAQLMEQGPMAAFLRTSNTSEELKQQIRADLAAELGGRVPGAAVLLATAEA